MERCRAGTRKRARVCSVLSVFAVRRYLARILAVCLSQDGVQLKRLNVGSRRQRHAIALEPQTDKHTPDHKTYTALCICVGRALRGKN